jgi:hypothetical protein
VQQGVFSPPSQTVLAFSTFARVNFEIKRRIVSEKKAETKWKKLMFDLDLIMDHDLILTKLPLTKSDKWSNT